MRTRTLATIGTAVGVMLATTPLSAGTLDGTVKLGGVIFSDEGDLSAVQETYDVYDGFSVSQIRLLGTLDPRNHFMLDLREVNLDSRQGEILYRVPGVLKLTAGFDQSRQIFDPERAVSADRKDWKGGFNLTPARWIGLSGSFNHLARTGERLSFPLGTESALGDRYDHTLATGELTAALRKNRYGGALTYRRSDFSDDRNADADRTGQVLSARLYGPDRFYDKWTHLLRGAYGVRELSDRDVDYTLSSVQYIGTVQPVDVLQFRYGFEAQRVDHETTELKTDRIRNDLDATWFHAHGRISGGYGYETNDDDRSLTATHSWRAGATWRYRQLVTAKVDGGGRQKDDEEDLTLLKDVESSRVRAKLQVSPREHVAVGAGFARRLRQMPDIDVHVDGEVASVFARIEAPGWGALAADYSRTTDEYLDRAGRFDTRSYAVTARVEVERIRDVRLAGGVTYLEVGRDLDIEKSIVFLEGRVKLLPGYHLEVKYNAYNYDDFILWDRYYTANVVRIDLAYDLHL